MPFFNRRTCQQMVVEVDLAAQVGKLRGPEPVSVGHQDHQPVASAVAPPSTRGLDQALDFLRLVIVGTVCKRDDRLSVSLTRHIRRRERAADQVAGCIGNAVLPGFVAY
jgi:hypothetical protein